MGVCPGAFLSHFTLLRDACKKWRHVFPHVSREELLLKHSIVLAQKSKLVIMSAASIEAYGDERMLGS